MPPQKVQTRQNSNRYQKRNEVNVMMNIAVVNRNQLKGIFDTDNLKGTTFKVTITPISEEEADEIKFKSLKGIAGRPLDADEVRRERLGL